MTNSLSMADLAKAKEAYAGNGYQVASFRGGANGMEETGARMGQELTLQQQMTAKATNTLAM